MFQPNDFTFSLFPSPSHDWLSTETLHSDGASAVNHLQIPAPDASDEEDVLISEHVQHVAAVPPETHARILQFVHKSLPSSEAARCVADFPSLRHLDLYLQLYFEHLHPRMPFLHIPTFDVDTSAWHLVLAAAAIGSQYSTASQSQKHLALFHRLGHYIISNDVSIFYKVSYC